MRYSTKQEAMEQAVYPAFGEHADDFDIEEIFAATFEYRTDEDADGNQLLNTAGFEQIVSDEEFWKIAERHHRVES